MMHRIRSAIIDPFFELLITMMHQIRSGIIDPLLVLFLITIVTLRGLKDDWTTMHNLPRKEKVRLVAKETFQLASRIAKLFAQMMKQGWSVPIAAHGKYTYERLINEQNRALTNGTLTDEQCNTSNIQIARVMLGAVFDRVTIQHISTFAARMGLYQLEKGSPVFNLSLEPQDVINLMEQRVPAICISYKHTRRSREGLPKDIARVQKAVMQAASQLSQERLLFWCDVIGHTPQEVSWAEQGIDPYLCMPTLRIVSAKLREEIDDSFWMTIERLAGQIRGGILSYDEDEARLKFGSVDDGYFVEAPDLSRPLEMGKLIVAKLICHPILYYRRARCEDDKLEVMTYAVSSTISGLKNFYGLQQNDAGLFKVGSDDGMLKALKVIPVIGINKVAGGWFAPMTYLSRPQEETIIGDGERWSGLEESFPVLHVFESQIREAFNRGAREEAFLIRQLSPAVDNVTDVICAPLGSVMCCVALRLRVAGFEEHDDRVTGRVVSFRVATEEEEVSLTMEASINKRVCFH